MPARSSSERWRACASRRSARCIDCHAAAVADHGVARDEYVADRAAVGAPNQLQADIAPRRPTPVRCLVNNYVGLLADLERADAGRHPDGLGARDRRHLERLMRTEPFWLEPGVARDAQPPAPRRAGCRRGRRHSRHRNPSATRPPRSTISACRPARVTPWPRRRYAHGQYAIAVRVDSTRSTSSSSSHTPCPSSRCDPSTPRWSRWVTGRRPVRAR